MRSHGTKRKGSGGQNRKEPQLFTGKKPARASKNEPPPAKRRRWSFWRFLFRLTFKLSILAVIVGAAGFSYIWLTLSVKGVFQLPEQAPGTMILAADGSVLAERGAFYGDKFLLSDLPDYVPNALIAIEDRRFRSHHGVDPLGLARAMLNNLRAGHMVEGGSTLTQQLAKNLFLNSDRTMARKAQEVVVAIWLENKYSKDEILQLYLNRIYFGGGSNGIEKAAQSYFNKSATDLNLAEAATLAGLLKAPTSYNPLTHPKESAARTKLVLKAMAEEGYITRKEANQALTAPTTVVASDYLPASHYVTDWVVQQLPLLVKTADESMIVETTINPDLQALGEESLRRHLRAEGKNLNVSEGAMVMLDPNGAVIAMIGGRSYKRSQFNRATTALRQPGSTFKPFVYLAALETGLTPDSVEDDKPIRIGNWAPENYKDKYMGPVTLRTAMAMSLNTVAARLVNLVGPDAVVAVARRLGIVSPLGHDASIALGTSVVTPLELTSAFAAFANGGHTVIPYVVKRITTRDGKVLYEHSGEGAGQTISPLHLAEMNTMLRAVVNEGTAKKAQMPGFDIAGKTGTSQNYRDAWFIGYSSYYIAGVWVGNDNNSPTRNVTGGSIPAMIWRDVMDVAHAGLPPQPLPGSPGESDPQQPYAVSSEDQALLPDQQAYTPTPTLIEQTETAPSPGFFGSLFGNSDAERDARRKRREQRRHDEH